LAYSRPNT